MDFFITNINFKTSKETIKKEFENYGEVKNVKLIMDKNTGQSKGYGFVEMSKNVDPTLLVKMNQLQIDGRKIIIKKAKPLKK